ncbi:MAG: hypothetical protein NTX91_05490 [candidate division SR1 bacterium]|nr:hypothetical protein [candidate division SR1 bacterium]
MALSLFRRSVLITTIVIAVTDFVVFFALKKKGTDLNTLTWKFVLLVVIITIIPIVINFRVHFILKK